MRSQRRRPRAALACSALLTLALGTAQAHDESQCGIEKPTASPPSSPLAQGCDVVRADLASARRAYAEQCSAPRVDCDVVPGGWRCASYVLGTSAPNRAAVGTAPTAPTPTVDAPAPVSGGVAVASLRAQVESAASAGGLWLPAGEYIEWRGPNRFSANAIAADGHLSFDFDIPTAGLYQFTMRSKAVRVTNPSEPPNDVWVKLPGNPWTKAYLPKPRSGDWTTYAVGERAGLPHAFELLQARLPAGRTTVTISGRSTGFGLDWIELRPLGGDGSGDTQGGGALNAGGGGGGDASPTPPRPAGGGSGDLIALHYDLWPDWDDFHAMVAARHVLDAFPERRVQAVVGTIPLSFNRVLPGHLAHAEAMFPGAIDAFAPAFIPQGGIGAPAVAEVADIWQATLAAGNRVDVADGGPSDFTANVIRLLLDRGVTGLERITVVQHSVTANQARTRPANLELIRRNANYVVIADGNGDNATPGYLSRDPATCARFRDAAFTSAWAERWRFAYAAIPAGDNRCVDFSDTVELLHILGIPKSAAPNPDGFIARFMR